MNDWIGCAGCNVSYSECLKAKNRLRCSLLREQAESIIKNLQSELNAKNEEDWGWDY